jgi:hypothetical protein
LYYNWRGYTNYLFEGRILRLFETGHQQEDRIVMDLLKAGYEVWAADERGKQFTYLDASGHGVVKLDGVIKGVPGYEEIPLVLEIKSHNDKSYGGVNSKGVAAEKRFHYWQVQMGIWLTQLTGGLYVSVNKNDEQLYFEYIAPDLRIQSKIQETIESLVRATIIPTRISETPDDYFGCRWCDHKAVCTGKAEPERHCRSCVYSKPWDNGEWLCTKLGVLLNREDQLNGCSEYEVKK